MNTPPQDSASRAFTRWQSRLPQEHSKKQAALWQCFAEWHAQKRIEVYSTLSPTEKQANAIVIHHLRETPKGQRIAIWANDKRVARLKFYELTLKPGSELAALPPLELAHAALNRSHVFYSYDGRQFCDFSPSNYRYELVRQPAEAAVERLNEALLTILYGPDAKSWPNYDAKKELMQELSQTLVQEEMRCIRKAHHKFIGQLDPNALKVMRRIKTTENWTYEWLTGSLEGSGSEIQPAAGAVAQRNRQQAATAFPALIFHFRRDREVTGAIDRGENLVSAICTSLSERGHHRQGKLPVTAECVRGLGGLRPSDVDTNYKWHPYMRGNATYSNEFTGDIGFFSAIPPEWRPQTRLQWYAISRLKGPVAKWCLLTGQNVKDVLRDFGRYATSIARSPQVLAQRDKLNADQQVVSLENFTATLKETTRTESVRTLVKTGLPDGKVTPAFLAGLDKIEYSRQGVFHRPDKSLVEDFLGRCVDQVVLPALVRACAHEKIDWPDLLGQHSEFSIESSWPIGKIGRALFSGTTFLQVAKASRDWHKQVGFMETQISRYNKPCEWPALISPITAPNGVSITCLHTSAQLRQEGKDMEHCVGGYTYKCMFEDSHILSLKAADGSWRTTAQVFAEKGKFTIAQHYLKRNGTALPQAAHDAIEWLKQNVVEGKIPVNWDSLKVSQAERTKRMREHRRESIILRIGFDPLNTADSENAYTRWQHTVPYLLKEKSYSSFIEEGRVATAIAQAIAEYRAEHPARRTTSAPARRPR